MALKRIMKTDEVAEHFRVHVETVRRWVRLGVLRKVRGFRVWRFTSKAVREFEQPKRGRPRERRSA